MTSRAFYLIIRIIICRIFGCRLKSYKTSAYVHAGSEVASDGIGGLINHPVYNLVSTEHYHCKRCGAVTGEKK